MDFEPSRDFVHQVMSRVRQEDDGTQATLPSLRERAALAVSCAGGMLGLLGIGRFCLGIVSPALCG